MITLSVPGGRSLRARGLIDPGSEASFIEAALIQKLGTNPHEANVSVNAIGGNQVAYCRKQVNLRIMTRQGNLNASFYVLPRLGIKSPRLNLEINEWPHLRDLDLADPNYLTSSKVDALIGANLYGSIILHGLRRGVPGAPVAQHTSLGWIVTGLTNVATPPTLEKWKSTLTSNLEVHDYSNELLRRFWELEEVNQESTHLSTQDRECERLFTEGCRRDSEGRYIVRLPIKPEMTTQLARTIKRAQLQMARTHALMRRNPSLQKEYNLFMQEYEQSGHMRRIPAPTDQTIAEPQFYLPHHGVWQKTDGRKKLRVVFNASCQSDAGVSLNEALYTGPALQRDLASIVIRWMYHRVAFCCDIGQMYRQIKVDDRDVDLQRIIWQGENDEAPAHFQLLTVTYGLSCAPYLAIRTLQQLAVDEGTNFPLAKESLRLDTYVDDIVTGAKDLTSAMKLKGQLIELLKAGGFPLRKWVSNHPRLLDGLSEGERLRPHWKDFVNNGPVHTLGISWDPTMDELRFTTPPMPEDGLTTKRKVLSTTAKLFDPTGWLSPFVIRAKIFLQELWKKGIGWDEALSPELLKRWNDFQGDFQSITQIKIPRWLGTGPETTMEIHGFCDASQHAYAAVVYCRIILTDGRSYSRLLTSKTKVAPVKTITVPRLELCAALLLTRLLGRLSRNLDWQINRTRAWSDSRTVLSWLSSEPSRWTVFVANRVSEIQTSSRGTHWNYVPSKENPADLASRGMRTSDLARSDLWWHGPLWLSKPSSGPTNSANQFPADVSEIDREAREVKCLQVQIQLSNNLLARFSSLTHLIRVVAWCLRLRLSQKTVTQTKPQSLGSGELKEAFLRCVRLSQRISFSKEIDRLNHGATLGKPFRLAQLSPFVDRDGTLRVGGRLQASDLPFAERHPAILSGNCCLSQLVVGWAHRAVLHGGASLTYSQVLRRVWILGGRQKVREHIRKCVKCLQSRERTSTQMMGCLPASRVKITRPFFKVGVDYAGPLQVRTSSGRGTRSKKGYIALFVCLSSKAVHLEAVGDLTTRSFLAALRRFSSRRGVPAEIWSDNATTFHGADVELRGMLREAEMQWNTIAGTLANEGIEWRFIPPSAPHFGGLWEAAIKSAKSHMKRVIGHQTLTFEELSTFLAQVEFCMNSRPLTLPTGDPDDILAITPWHLITGFPPQQIPEPSHPESISDHVSRWRLVQAMRDHFWSRWSREYLNTLQQRNKWRRPTADFQVNDLALIIDPSLLRQGRWPMGRVTGVSPGPDGRVRVVTIKTPTGSYVRPITRLCKLFSEGAPDQSQKAAESPPSTPTTDGTRIRS